jgi:hypothetical protein
MHFSRLIAIIISSSMFISACSGAYAESPAKTEPAPAVKPKAAAAPAKPEAVIKAKVDDLCACAKPAADALNKAYTALEEDEWTNAETTTKNAIASIKSQSQSCKCPELASYQKIADAYLKYAQGGNHLDGADQPNCPYALKLYADAIALLKEAIPSLTNAEVKANATNIQDYADEELQFVKDECEDTKPTATPAKKP